MNRDINSTAEVLNAILLNAIRIKNKKLIVWDFKSRRKFIKKELETRNIYFKGALENIEELFEKRLRFLKKLLKNS